MLHHFLSNGIRYLFFIIRIFLLKQEHERYPVFFRHKSKSVTTLFLTQIVIFKLSGTCNLNVKNMDRLGNELREVLQVLVFYFTGFVFRYFEPKQSVSIFKIYFEGWNRFLNVISKNHICKNI